MSETDTAIETTEEGAGDGFWDLGVVATLLVVGFALVVFPEPATTITGALLVAVGLSLAVLELVA